VPHTALLEKWLQIGLSGSPADDREAIEFIRAIWGHRGYDAWTREADDGLPPFVLIAEGEPRRLAVGHLRFAGNPDPLPARRCAMAMLLALENLLKKEQRDIGVLIAADELQVRQLGAVLPPLELLVDCVLTAGAPAVLPAAARFPWSVRDAPLDKLAAEVEGIFKL
jgi:hypothetical protein